MIVNKKSFFDTDDVSYQIRSCGVLSIRAHGRNGRGATREGKFEEANQRRTIWRWPLNLYFKKTTPFH